MLYFTADIISTVEFNHDGELLATGDKGGRIVIFQKDDSVSVSCASLPLICLLIRCFLHSLKDLRDMESTVSIVHFKVTSPNSIILKVWK